MSEVRVGSDFTIFAPSGRWLSAASHGAPPVFPHNGARYHDIDTQKDYYWSGTAWTEVLSNPNYNDEYWDDLRFPASVFNPGIANAPDPVALGDPYGQLYALEFNANVEEEVYVFVQMPHAWKEGSTIHPHVHWINHDGGSGNVIWALEYSITNINDKFPTPTTISVTDAGIAADGDGLYTHQIAELGEIAMTGKTISCMMMARLYRDADNELDTLDGEAGLIEFDIHYQKDSTGSSQEYVK